MKDFSPRLYIHIYIKNILSQRSLILIFTANDGRKLFTEEYIMCVEEKSFAKTFIIIFH